MACGVFLTHFARPDANGKSGASKCGLVSKCVDPQHSRCSFDFSFNQMDTPPPTPHPKYIYIYIYIYTYIYINNKNKKNNIYIYIYISTQMQFLQQQQGMLPVGGLLTCADAGVVGDDIRPRLPQQSQGLLPLRRLLTGLRKRKPVRVSLGPPDWRGLNKLVLGTLFVFCFVYFSRGTLPPKKKW